MLLINDDCYKAIKQIPDKSIDLVYIDIPYLYESTGSSSDKGSPLNRRIGKTQNEYLKEIKNGIDYNILDDLCRVQKKLYIYGVANYKL